MKTNIGSADKVIRIIAGVVLALLYFAGITEGTTGLILLGLGVVLLGTATLNFCPLYLPFGISTKPKNK